MTIHEEFEKELESHIKRYKLSEEPAEVVECDNCGGGYINRFATKSDHVIKMQACYQCGPGSIQILT